MPPRDPVHEDQAELAHPAEWAAAERFLPPRLLDRLRSPIRDDHPEHIRYEAFLELLRPESPSNEVVHLIVRLAELDPDPVMARSVVNRLAQHPGISPSQFDRVAQTRLVDPAIVIRAKLLGRLRHRDEADVRVLEDAAREGDRVVHAELLRIDALPSEVLQALADGGANKAIRNAARRRLQRASAPAASRPPPGA